MKLLNTLKERWTAKSPTFFVGIKKLAIAIGSSAMAVWLANQNLSLELSPIILNVCKYTITACAAMGLTAQLTKQ